MSIAQLMRDMAAAGAPLQAIIMAVEALETRDNAAKAEREKTAERKRRQRARERDSHVTVTGQSPDIAETDPLSLPPNEKISNPPTHTPVNNTPARKGPIFVCPEAVDPAVWADFLRARKTKGCTNSATAYAKVLRDISAVSLATGEPPGRVVEEAAARGWASIYDWTNGQGKPRNGTANRQHSASYPARDKRDGFAKALDAIIDGGGTDGPTGYADRSANDGFTGDGGLPTARVITLRPADLRQVAADDASGPAHAVYR